MLRAPRKPRRLIVGLDPAPSRLGWAVGVMVGAKPIACGVVAVEDWRESPVGVADAFAVIAGAIEAVRGEVALVAVERPFVAPRNPHTSLMCAEAMGQVALLAAMRWPEAELVRLRTGQWREGVGVPYNASKREVRVRAAELGWPVRGCQDAADAACMAVSARTASSRCPLRARRADLALAA